jgi:hypothetical protein
LPAQASCPTVDGEDGFEDVEGFADVVAVGDDADRLQPLPNPSATG